MCIGQGGGFAIHLLCSVLPSKGQPTPLIATAFTQRAKPLHSAWAQPCSHAAEQRSGTLWNKCLIKQLECLNGTIQSLLQPCMPEAQLGGPSNSWDNSVGMHALYAPLPQVNAQGRCPSHCPPPHSYATAVYLWLLNKPSFLQGGRELNPDFCSIYSEQKHHQETLPWNNKLHASYQASFQPLEAGSLVGLKYRADTDWPLLPGQFQVLPHPSA